MPITVVVFASRMSFYFEQVLMVNEFEGGTYTFAPAGSAGSATVITGETWLANFGISDVSVKQQGIVVLLSLSAALLVVTYVSLALRKYVK